MRRRRCSTGGFTLLEIMIALAILSISLITLLTANNNAIALTAKAGDFTDAVTLARLEMEKYNLAPLPEPGIKAPVLPEDFPGFAVRAEVEETDIPDVREIVITIWKKAGEDESLLYTLTSHLSSEGFFGRPPAQPKPATSRGGKINGG